MKNRKVKFNEDYHEVKDVKGNKYAGADWKDQDAILGCIDELLKPKGLELCVGHLGDDYLWLSIEKQ